MERPPSLAAPRYPLGSVIRFDLSQKIAAAVQSLVSDGTLPSADYGVPEVADTKDESHGDYACNIAMVSAKKAGKNPRELATLIAEVLARQPEFEAVEVAGPGFLNLRLRPEFVAGYVGRILDLGEDLAKVEGRRSKKESDRPSTLDPRSSPLKINVEFVSVNPNGPITVGSGRGAAFGSTLCNVLAAAGNEVHREYYINDATNSEQMRMFQESVENKAREKLGLPPKHLNTAYKGDYVNSIADSVIRSAFRRLPDIRKKLWYDQIAQRAYFLRSNEFESPSGLDRREALAEIVEKAPTIRSIGRKFAAIPKELRAPADHFYREFRKSKSITSFLTIFVVAALKVLEQTQPLGVENDPEFEDDLEDIVLVLLLQCIEGYNAEGRWSTVGGFLKSLPPSGFLSRRVIGSTIREAIEESLTITAMHEQDGLDPQSVQALFVATESLDLLFPDAPEDSKLPRGWYFKDILAEQKADLTDFGVNFDTWFSEQSLHDSNTVEKCIQELQAKGVADEKPYRTILKMGRGGVIEEVVKEEQAGEEDEGASPNGHQVVAKLSSESEPHGDQQVTTGRQPGDSQTLWLRSTKFADDMDRVLRRKDGRLTYIASDVAYHKDKLLDESGVRKTGPVDKMITILGPDHHGYIHRLQAVLAALLEKVEGRGSKGESEPPPPAVMDRAREEEGAGGGGLSETESQIYRSPEERDACQAALEEARRKLEVVIFQIVRFVKDGKPAPMRKRDGNIYALIDLINELGKNIAPTAPIEEQQRIGKDVARFFYLMRSHETHMDFDIDLATKQSEENPVFYAQYAHARICSILEKAKGEFGLSIVDFGLNPDSIHNQQSTIRNPKELALIKKICDLPFEVARCAEDYGVHRLTTYAVELARAFHHFYDACRVIEPDQPEQTQARLALCEATKIGLRGVFDLLGISAPEKMERAAAEPSS